MTAQRKGARVSDSINIDELLAPTLSDEDDVAGFNSPWNPNSLVLATFFSGLIAGGVLLAINAKRLGLPKRTLPTLIVSVVAGVGLQAVVAWVLASGMIPKGGSTRALQFGIQGISVAIAFYLAEQQRKRFRIFEATGRPSGKLLVPVVIALVGGFIVNYGLLIAFLTGFILLMS